MLMHSYKVRDEEWNPHFWYQRTEMLKKEDKKSKDVQQSTVSLELSVVEKPEPEPVHSILDLTNGKGCPVLGGKAQCCAGFVFIVLGVITMILAVIEIVVTGLGAATEGYYDAPHSGRLIAMVVLAVIAAAVLGLVIYAIVGVKNKHTKPLHTTAVVLLILIIIQALITGLSVNITNSDELNIARSLSESFFRSTNGDPVQLENWNSLQSDLECCGLYSPEDYRDPYAPLYFPPAVPLSCCPPAGYPNNTREKDLQMCKAHDAYYGMGCKVPVLEIIKGASVSVIVASVLLIVAEMVIAILGAILSKKRQEEKCGDVENVKNMENVKNVESASAVDNSSR